PVEAQSAAQAGVGAFAGECLLLLWIGRKYYGAAVIAALRGGRDEDQRAVATYMRALLIGAGAMVAMLVTLGAPLFHAALAVLLLLGFMLVLARMVAEAGIPFVQTPTGCFLTEVLFSLTGVALPATALAPLMLVGAGLMSDTRENLLPYAVQAEYLGDRAGVPRRRLSALMLLVAATGAAACTAMVVWIFYSGDHIPDSWPLSTLSRDNLQPLADVVDGRPPADSPWAAYGIGMAVVGAVGIARMMFAWWPLHPLGAIVVPSASTAFIWFSFFIGWLVKIAVMRYGGVGLYQRLRPFAIGLIVGEALVAAVFLVIGMALRWAGVNLPQLPHFLPG
ncbi:MAG: hypothetical protein H0X45_17005, partial [Planctomycetes bacterium]|nr:hypothetical protein [Planctomycetota bacterium]